MNSILDVIRTGIIDPSIPEDSLYKIKRLLPSDDDIKKLLFEKSTKVTLEEKFLREFSEIYKARERFDAILTKIEIISMLSNIRMTIAVIKNTCMCVKNSYKFALIMSYLLAVGNHLNDEKTTGFTVESLRLLWDTASKANNGTKIIEFLCAILYSDFQELHNLSDELSCIHEATKYEANPLMSQQEEIMSKMKDLLKKIEDIANDVGQKFATTMNDFVKDVKEALPQLSISIEKDFKDTYKDLCAYLGEPIEKPATPDDLFKTLDEFVERWNSCMKRLIDADVKKK